MSAPFQISEAASLALHAAVYLAARPERAVPVRRIAEELDASSAHLSKVLQRLARAGLVRSVRGPAGGYALAAPADEITLLSVYETMEGPLVPPVCLFDEPICDSDCCLLGRELQEANRRLRERLAGRSVADFVDLFAEETS